MASNVNPMISPKCAGSAISCLTTKPETSLDDHSPVKPFSTKYLSVEDSESDEDNLYTNINLSNLATSNYDYVPVCCIIQI